MPESSSSTPGSSPGEPATGRTTGTAGTAATGRTPGAPIPPGEIDPELVKLPRSRPKIGVITAAGVVLLCGLFVYRLSSDRRFAGRDPAPEPATVTDIVAGKLELDTLLKVGAEPLVSHAIRASKDKTGLGLRLVPARGTGDQLWIAISGDGWDPPALEGYSGRLRRLDDLPFATAVRDFALAHPRPLFATAAAVRAGFAAGSVTTVNGPSVKLDDGVRVAFDVIDREVAIVVASFNERLPDTPAWAAALGRAGLAPGDTVPNDALGQVRIRIAGAPADVTQALERAELWAARVEPVTVHHEATWGVLRGSPANGMSMASKVVPDDQIELIGLYVAGGIPDGAYALVTGEHPEDYWYVLPITIALVAIGLLFAWALVRVLRRELSPARVAADS